MFSDALIQRSVAQTWTPNSRLKKIDDDARPQPRSRTRIPGCRSSAAVSHSVIQSALAPPLAFARTHSGWYCDDRGKRSEKRRLSVKVTTPMLFIELANGVYREIRCIARSRISEFRIALTRASVRTVSDASNDDNRNTETHADLRYCGTLHLDGDGIELTPQFRAVRGTGHKRIPSYDQPFSNRLPLHC